jgi:hypothetical protein
MRWYEGLSRAGETRLQWMLFYFFNGRNAQRTRRQFGISRQTFYRPRSGTSTLGYSLNPHKEVIGLRADNPAKGFHHTARFPWHALFSTRTCG